MRKLYLPRFFLEIAGGEAGDVLGFQLLQLIIQIVDHHVATEMNPGSVLALLNQVVHSTLFGYEEIDLK